MSYEFFTKRPGKLPSRSEGNMQVDVIGDGDVIRLPDELGGGVREIIARGMAPCVCGEHDALTWVISESPEGVSDGLCVCECINTGEFRWYRLKE